MNSDKRQQPLCIVQKKCWAKICAKSTTKTLTTYLLRLFWRALFKGVYALCVFFQHPFESYRFKQKKKTLFRLYTYKEVESHHSCPLLDLMWTGSILCSPSCCFHQTACTESVLRLQVLPHDRWPTSCQTCPQPLFSFCFPGQSSVEQPPHSSAAQRPWRARCIVCVSHCGSCCYFCLHHASAHELQKSSCKEQENENKGKQRESVMRPIPDLVHVAYTVKPPGDYIYRHNNICILSKILRCSPEELLHPI